MLSVNTNYSAMVALQNLGNTNKELEEVQGRINTGLKVAGAKDNGAVYAIAEGQRSRVSALAAVADGISRATSSIDVALAAGKSIGDILQQLKSRAVSAQMEDLTTEQRSAIQADYDAYRSQINQIAGSAEFNGFNLVGAGGLNLNVLMSDLSSGTAGRQVTSTPVAGLVPGLSAYVVGNGGVTAADDTTFNLNGAAIGTVDITATMTVQDYLDEVTTQTGGRIAASYDQTTGTFTYVAVEGVAVSNELTVTTPGTARAWLGQGVAAGAVSGASPTLTVTDLDFSVAGSGALSTVSGAANTLASSSSARTTSAGIDSAIVALNRQMASLGSQAKGLEIQKNFLTSLSDTVSKGIGNLVDADLAKESARLQSLQIKQQLGAQALSIANQSPQVIMSLFRN